MAGKLIRKLWLILFIVVFIILYNPPIIKTTGTIFLCTFGAVKDFQSLHANLKTPHAGEHILPPATREILAFLRKHQLASYNVSEKIKNDELIYQRTIESAWPVRMSPESNYKFIFVSERDHVPSCTEVERQKEVALVFCR